MIVKQESLKRTLLSVFVLITLTQLFFIQSPSIYKVFRYSSLVVLAFLVLLMGNTFLYYIRRPIINLFFIANIFNIFSVLIISLLAGTIYFTQINLLLIPFLVFVVSYDAQFSEKHIISMLNLSSIILAGLGLFIVIKYGGDSVSTGRYIFASKNQIGIPMALMVVYLFYCIQYKITNFSSNIHINNLINSGIAIMIFYSLLIIRNRTGIAGVLFVIMLILISSMRHTFSFKRVIIYFILISTVQIMISYNVITNPVTLLVESMTANYSINDLDNLSSGRVVRLSDGLNFVFNHAPFLGDSNKDSGIRSPHMFVVYQWTRFGLFFSIPAVSFYAFLWLRMFIGMFHTLKAKITLQYLGYWMLLLSLFSSFLEYDHPFGPGSSFTLLWFLLAYTFKNGEYKGRI